MSKKVTKEELRHDPVAEAIKKFFGNVIHFKPDEKQKKIGGIVLLVVVLAGIYYYSTRPRYNSEAQLMLIQAMSSISRVSPQDTNSVQVLLLLRQITTKYNGTVSAKRALYYTGLYYFKMNRLDSAEEYFNSFLSRGVKDPLLESSSLAYLGSISIAKGDSEGGYTYLIKAARKAPLKTLKAYYLYRAARIKESEKNYEEAYTLLKRIKEEFPEFNLGRPGDIDEEMKLLKNLMEVRKG